MAPPDTFRIRQTIRNGAYRLTLHAEQEREADAITVQEIEDAFGAENVELLEEYADDPRGHSVLYLGFTRDGQPIHAVLGLSEPDTVVFITVYRPRPDLWYEWRKRL
ncbi:MAG: DUF4258 domain-containing protein [SAR202 cluster bacterium]|nr:DUF4258 domain-containing protein [SAR202 cluster bacterium]